MMLLSQFMNGCAGIELVLQLCLYLCVVQLVQGVHVHITGCAGSMCVCLLYR